MSKSKTNIRQHQFGFPDEDLKTSLHDEIVLWLKKNCVELSKRILEWNGTWDTKLVEVKRSSFLETVEQCKQQLREELKKQSEANPDTTLLGRTTRHNQQALATLESWAGLGEPPPRQFIVQSKLEVPITRHRYQTVDIIGYADILYSIMSSSLQTPAIPVDRYGKFEVDKLKDNLLCWKNAIDLPSAIALDAKSTIPSLGELIRCLRTYRTFCGWPFYIVSPEARFAEAIADEGFGFIQYPDGIFLRPRKQSEFHSA